MRDYENVTIIKEKESQLEKLTHAERMALDVAYDKRYDLDEAIYQQKWLPIQQTIFDPKAKWFPDMMFLPEFELFFMLPDFAAVTRRQLTKLKRCMRALGEKEFVIIENERLFQATTARCNPQAKVIKHKYPSTLTYTQFLDGGKDVLFTVGGEFLDHEAYLTFGESGQWGLYAPANEYQYEYAVYILGFRKEVASLFIEHFKDFNTEKEKKYILEECFPHMPAYQKYDKYLR